MNKTTKKYKAIVKIKNNVDGTAYCVVYRFDNLLKFSQFIDVKWEDWKWYNVYSNKKENKGMQLGSFTKFNRPSNKDI